jgi:hypothetical protein
MRGRNIIVRLTVPEPEGEHVMPRRPAVIPVLLSLAVVVVLLCIRVPRYGGSAAAQGGAAGRAEPPTAYKEPDTKAPSWKTLSKDVGLQLNRESSGELRGQFFVRVDNRWVPIVTDRPEDVTRIVPAK